MGFDIFIVVLLINRVNSCFVKFMFFFIVCGFCSAEFGLDLKGSDLK